MIVLPGIPLVAGEVTGTVMVVGVDAHMAVPAEGASSGSAAIAAARQAAEADLRRQLERLPDGAARGILHAHLTLLSDPLLSGAIATQLERGLAAADALAEATLQLTSRFAALDNPELRDRAVDLQDVSDAMMRYLRGQPRRADAPQARVVCAAELSPADVLHLLDSNPVAFALETSADTSHAAILIRAAGVPAVIGVTGMLTHLRDGSRVTVDGERGAVIVDSAQPVTGAAVAVRTGAGVSAGPPVRTSDGVDIAVTATIAGAHDARRARALGAEGIGLFRTEWLFMHDRLPSEDEQVDSYRQVAAVAADWPVTVRVIDLGGDKRPRALDLPREPNPALGLRGLRFALSRPELLQTQIRGLVRAFGTRLRLLLPMVIDPEDFSRVRHLLAQSIDRETVDAIRFGALIETPAAVMMADELASATDFLSLGTNDLTQYALAADREASTMKDAYQPLHPAVLRLLRHTAAAAQRQRKPLAVCGEAARHPVLAQVLLGLGVTEFSVTPDAIATVKHMIRGTSAEAARALAEELASLPTASAVLARAAASASEPGPECTHGA